MCFHVTYMVLRARNASRAYLVGVLALVVLIWKLEVGRSLHGRPGLNLHSRYRLHLLENVEQLDL